MSTRPLAILAATAVALAASACASGDPDGPADSPRPPARPPVTPQTGPVVGSEPVVETIADGLHQPWGLAFLPDRDQLLVTQLGGVLTLVDLDTGEVRELAGVPEVSWAGQGGLLDVAVDPDFPDPAWVYLTYAAPHEGATSTHLARGRLDADRRQLNNVEVLYVAEPRTTGQHYGSRVEFDADGYLFMTLGDRGDKTFANHVSQDPSNTLGTAIRLERDGSVPADNPFVGDPGVHDAIYSYGHRNAQGMTVHPRTGEIWLSEHGERDGDEINILQAGGNFGWPVATTACHYGTDTPLGDRPEDRPDLVAPVYFWECGTGGFPPAGMAFYYGDEFPAWEGDLLVGGLASQYLARFTVDGDQLTEAEPLLAGQGWRIRDVAVSPHDGAIYLAIDAANTPLVRLVNAAGR